MISVVVPIFNEEENLPELYRRMSTALDSTGEAWELVLVNDGSRDRSDSIIRQLHATDPRVKLVQLSRNFGHQPALTAGIREASGDCVVLSDGDLQDPPEVIPEMVAKWRDGYHAVLGERRSRADTGPRSIGFRLFYPILRRVSDVPGIAGGGIFGLMDRVLVTEFNKLPERNRFIPGLRSWLGFRQTSIFYDRQARAAGEAKQTFRKLFKYAMDGMISFSYKPLAAVVYLGFVISGLAFVMALYYLVTFFLFDKTPGSGFTTIIICVLFLGGIQLVSVGVIGQYIGRIYEEIKQRPLYIVQERLGISPHETTEAPTHTMTATTSDKAEAYEDAIAG
jgi:glycosyltransferase involved in cell wall biosynthesis